MIAPLKGIKRAIDLDPLISRIVLMEFFPCLFSKMHIKAFLNTVDDEKKAEIVRAKMSARPAKKVCRSYCTTKGVKAVPF